MAPCHLLPVTHRFVTKARKSFEADFAKKKPEHQLRLTFDELLKHFRERQLPHSRIAKSAGTSKQRLKQIFDRYFCRICMNGREAANERLREESRRRRSREDIRHLRLPRIGSVVKSARSSRCKVEAVRGADGSHVTGRIRVDGKLCAISHLTACYSPSGSGLCYANTQITRKTLANVDAVVFYVHPKGHEERIFVMPAAEIFTEFFAGCSDRVSKCIVLPVTRPDSGRTSAPRCDWWKRRENAWHSLQGFASLIPAPS